MNHDTRLTTRGAWGLMMVTGVVTVATITSTMMASEEAQLADYIDVTGVVRDFKERGAPGGHPDFEKRPDRGFAHYSGNVALQLGENRKPVFTGLGFKVTEQWRDSEHRQICYALYDASLGDNEGRSGQSSFGGVTSAETFAQWYQDLPGMNISAPLTLRLVLQGDGKYVFDDRDDPVYAELGGFFPIDDQLYGNSPGTPDHNFHFTFELHMECEYDAAAGQFFMFIGDDDVYIYVNDQLVVDLGGVHAAHDQYIDMDRLGLGDGETYRIDFFFAERHRTQSNFRIETNIPVRSTGVPTTTSAFD